MSLGNLFDVYEQAENRYTFALLYALDSDRKGLLRNFLKRVAGESVSSRALGAATVTCQGASEEAVGEGIPDGWIKWAARDHERAVALETKIVRGTVTRAQLKRHANRLAKIEGGGTLLVITPDEARPQAISKLWDYRPGVRVKHVRWPEVAAWVRAAKPRGAVARHLLEQLGEYMEMNEDLIDFRGIDFSDGGFEYRRAKSILRQLVREVRPLMERRKALAKLVHSRPKVTDNKHLVWDVLGLKGHTDDHHVTFGVHADRIDVAYTLPNSAPRSKWRRLSEEICRDRFWKTLAGLRHPGNAVLVRIAQRHAIGPYRFGPTSLDGQLEVKVDTDPVLWRSRKDKGVRPVAAWRTAVEEIMRRGKPKANVEFQVQSRWPYGPQTRSRKFLKSISRTLDGFSRIAACMQG